MKLLNFIKSLFLLTVLALIYIHMQMQIFQLAYQGKQKEHQIKELSEKNGVISCDIQMMKSANYLGANLLSGDSKLTFLDQNKIIQVVTAEAKPSTQVALSTTKTQRTNTLLSYISSRFSREAQAQEK